ncbi:hypothetical protein JXA88_16370 [Candidatus Fermentibacteria bacterium]|nr:hypothetical protein [Candidatus Fermentibacteria bacterium]
MAKDRSFSAKIAHETLRHRIICPVCNKEREPYLIVQGVRAEGSGTQRFRRQRVKVCACNRSELGLS